MEIFIYLFFLIMPDFLFPCINEDDDDDDNDDDDDGHCLTQGRIQDFFWEGVDAGWGHDSNSAWQEPITCFVYL